MGASLAGAPAPTHVPTACHHCGSTPPSWRRDYRCQHCRQAGHDHLPPELGLETPCLNCGEMVACLPLVDRRWHR